jgi:hypothetical protein
MSVQNSIFIGEVFQIELSDGLVHPLKSRQIVNLCPTRVFTGTRVLCFCKLLQFKRVTPMSIKNIMFIGEVFQIEVSAGLAHSLGVDKM